MLVYKIQRDNKTRIVKIHQGNEGPRGERGEQGPIGLTGAKGEPFRYEDFTQEQLDALHGVGVKSVSSEIVDNGTHVILHLTDGSEYQFFVEKGLQGQRGETGATGPKGDTGIGIPIGGTRKQVIVKNSFDNYDTSWDSVENVLKSAGLDLREMLSNIEVNADDISDAFNDIAKNEEAIEGNAGRITDVELTIDSINETIEAIGADLSKITYPTEGTVGQVLTIANNPYGNLKAEWQDPQGGSGLPRGGKKGEILIKNSLDDGDTVWGSASSALSFEGYNLDNLEYKVDSAYSRVNDGLPSARGVEELVLSSTRGTANKWNKLEDIEVTDPVEDPEWVETNVIVPNDSDWIELNATMSFEGQTGPITIWAHEYEGNDFSRYAENCAYPLDDDAVILGNPNFCTDLNAQNIGVRIPYLGGVAIAGEIVIGLPNVLANDNGQEFFFIPNAKNWVKGLLSEGVLAQYKTYMFVGDINTEVLNRMLSVDDTHVMLGSVGTVVGSLEAIKGQPVYFYDFKFDMDTGEVPQFTDEIITQSYEVEVSNPLKDVLSNMKGYLMNYAEDYCETRIAEELTSLEEEQY